MSRNRTLLKFSKVAWVLSLLLLLLSVSLLFPMVVSLIYREGIWMSYLLSILITTVVSGLGWFFFRPAEDAEVRDRELSLREGIMVVGVIWLLLSLFGALPFRFSGVLMHYTDAVFETASGLTTTGATIFGGTSYGGILNPAIEEIPKSLLFWRSFTHWIGGMGIIVLSIAILPLLGMGGMQLFQAESSLLVSDKLTPRVQDTAKQLWIVYALMTLTQFVLLWLHPSMDWFEAINHAFATLATGGFSTKNASIAAFDSLYVEMVTLVFMFMAGVNFVLHLRVFRGEPLAIFKNQEVRFYTKITFIAIILVSASLWRSNFYTVGDSFRYGSFQVVSIVTTTGFATDDFELWNSFGLFIIFLLFFTGGCAGSTAGGVKMFRWMVLIENAKREFKQILHPHAVLPVRLGDKTVDNGALRTVLSFAVLYLFTFGIGALVMSLFGYDFASSIGASIATLGNIGPGLGDFGPTDQFAGVPLVGKWMLILFMVIGRLEIFTVLVLFSSWFWKD